MSKYTLRSAEEKPHHDMFKPMSNMPTMDTSVGPDMYNEPQYQCVEFSVDALPEIQNWQVGNEYTLIIKVRETAHKVKDSVDYGSKEEAHFDILSVGAYSDAPEMQLHDKLIEKFNS